MKLKTMKNDVYFIHASHHPKISVLRSLAISLIHPVYLPSEIINEMEPPTVTITPINNKVSAPPVKLMINNIIPGMISIAAITK